VAPLVKSRQRVIDHGEVFTPEWIVEDMLDLVKQETERIESRFLEPACGSGNFLVAVLRRKLAVVQRRYGSRDYEKHVNALVALMSLYGIELLEDNVVECRQALLDEWLAYTRDTPENAWGRAAVAVLTVNIVWADALTMKLCADPRKPITFAEWSSLGKGLWQRRDFRYDTMTQMSSLGEGTLFGEISKHDIFTPTKEYPPMSLEEIAHG